jgi:predicted MFS family arabinose efflux permease
MFGFGLIALIPAWAVKILGGDVQTNGWLLSSRGAGALVAALMVATLSSRALRGKLWTIGGLMLPFLWIGFAQVRIHLLSYLAIAGIGFCFILVVNLTNALVQSHVEDRLRGRVMSIFSLLFVGLTPIGSLLAGVLSDWKGEPVTVMVRGLILLASAVFCFIKFPYRRKLG